MPNSYYCSRGWPKHCHFIKDPNARTDCFGFITFSQVKWEERIDFFCFGIGGRVKVGSEAILCFSKGHLKTIMYLTFGILTSHYFCSHTGCFISVKAFEKIKSNMIWIKSFYAAESPETHGSPHFSWSYWSKEQT